MTDYVPKDTEFPNVPNDTVSALSVVKFNDSYLVASGSWGNAACLWTVKQGGGNVYGGGQNLSVSPTGNYAHTSPVLGVAISVNQQTLYTGNYEGNGIAWNLATGQQQVFLKSENGPVKSVKFLERHNLVAAACYDKTVRLWDVRMGPGSTALRFNFSDRITAFDCTDDVAIAAVGTGKYAWLDIRNGAGSNPHATEKDSPLMSSGHRHYNTAAVACMKSDIGGAISSIEGRVMIEYLSNPSNSFPFRSHKAVEQQKSVSHAITTLDFSPNTVLASGGTDGTFSFWHYGRKQRISTYRIPNGAKCISAAAFSPDGSLYFYANSYNWFRGYNCEARNQPHKIMAHVLTNDEVKPKAR